MKFKFDQIAINSTSKKKPEPKDAANYVGLEHLTPGTFEISEWGSSVAPVGEKLLMKKGDVLFGRRRAYQRKVGIAPFDGIFSAHGMVLRPRTEVVDENYFPFFISSDQFMNEAVRISVGSLSPTINWGTLKNCEFDLPPMEEQKKVAELLWAANDLKEKYKKAITATDEMLKAKFREMFGDVGNGERGMGRILTQRRREGEFGLAAKNAGVAKSKWPVVEFQSVCQTFIDGDWIESKDQSENGVRLVQTGNVGVGEFVHKVDKARWISEETFNRLKCSEIFAGDILISRLPDPIGRACILPSGLGKAITAVDCTIIRLNDVILPKFLIAITESIDYKRQIEQFTAGTTRARISRGSLGKIQIPLPPLALQREFVAIAEKAEAAKTALKKSIADIDQVMKGLING